MSDADPEFIYPATAFLSSKLSQRIGAISTTRSGGVSGGAYAEFNLADHVGDDIEAVTQNRAMLAKSLQLEDLKWIQQVHGSRVLNAACLGNDEQPANADALWTDQKQVALCILTADCLPIFISDHQGQVVAMVHGGWRSLVGGIIQNVASALAASSQKLVGWTGPGISFLNYPIGTELRDEIRTAYGEKIAQQVCRSKAGNLHADLGLLAKCCMLEAGIHFCGQSALCSFADTRFFSYRRSPSETGRMASVIWIR